MSTPGIVVVQIILGEHAFKIPIAARKNATVCPQAVYDSCIMHYLTSLAASKNIG